MTKTADPSTCQYNCTAALQAQQDAALCLVGVGLLGLVWPGLRRGRP